MNFIDVPYWLGSVGDITVQAKLFENGNCIEIHTTHVEGDDAQTQGIEDANGNEGFAYPGRNGQIWSATNSYISFCPFDTSGLLYMWPDGNFTSINDELAPGTHVVTITDLNGCEETTSVTISTPVSDLVLDPEVLDVSCFGFADASIDPGVSGGSGNPAGYAYQWSNGSTMPTLSELGPGTYSVTMTDDAGCSIESESFTITEPELLQASVVEINNVACPGDADGSAKIITTGGVAPYVYSWSPIGATTANPVGLTDGTYQVQIVDASGCNAFKSVTILALNELPEVELGDDVQHTDGSPVTLDAGAGHATYTWSTGENTPFIEVTERGTYSVTVTNGAECASSDEVYVDIWALGVEEFGQEGTLHIYPNPTLGNITITLPAGVTNGTLTVTDNTGRKVMDRTLGEAVNSVSLDGLASGVYNFTVIDSENKTYRSKVVLR